MSFLLENNHFKELSNPQNILLDNIEEDLDQFVKIHIAYIYYNAPNLKNTFSFNFSLETSKNRFGFYETSGNIDKDEYLRSDDQAYISERRSFESKIMNLYHHISDYLDKISYLIDKPLSINFSSWNFDFTKKHNKIMTEPDSLYYLLKKLKTDCFLDLISEYGENIKITYQAPSDTEYKKDIAIESENFQTAITIKTTPDVLTNDIKKTFSFYIINKFLTDINADEKSISFDSIKNINKTEIFEQKLKEAISLYQKKSIIQNIANQEKDQLNNDLTEKNKRI